MNKVMFDNLSGHYSSQILTHLKNTCILDPRLKLTGFSSEREKNDKIRDMKTELKPLECSTLPNSGTASSTSQFAKEHKGEKPLLSPVY